jgi:hypothetical protein
VHSGIGALLQGAGNGGNTPVCYQPAATATTYGFPVTPGQVWRYTAYGEICESFCGVTPDSTFRGLLKVVFNNSTGTAVPPQVDGNFVGGLDTAPYYGITSSPELTSGSAPDTWTLLECQGTVPTNAAYIQFFNITVGVNGYMEFDDETAILATNTTVTGWQNLGPTWAASGVTNQISDPITTKQKFYRVTTP